MPRRAWSSGCAPTSTPIAATATGPGCCPSPPMTRAGTPRSTTRTSSSDGWPTSTASIAPATSGRVIPGGRWCWCARSAPRCCKCRRSAAPWSMSRRSACCAPGSMACPGTPPWLRPRSPRRPAATSRRSRSSSATTMPRPSSATPSTAACPTRIRYAGAITLDQRAVLRVTAFRSGWSASLPVTATFDVR
jgi:hypothetical protein